MDYRLYNTSGMAICRESKPDVEQIEFWVVEIRKAWYANMSRM